MLPLPSGSGVVFLCVLRRQQAFGDQKLFKRNQVHMKCVWRLLPGALGEWRGHRLKASVVIEPSRRNGASGRIELRSTILRGAAGGNARGHAVVDIGAVSGEIPSP